MKKIILTGVALMAFAAAGSAQNMATLNQVGTSQNSTQTQSGNVLTSTVTQGNGTNAMVNTLNKSLTNQVGKYHSATVTQDDNADNNNAVIKQTGSGLNTADGNKATILQQDDSGGMGGMRSTTFGKETTAGKGNYAAIEQSSTANEADISQSDNSSSNYGRIFQTGSSNKLSAGAPGPTFIRQNNQSSGNAALIEQPGNENGGQINQTVNSLENEATITQISTDNLATIDQNYQSSKNTASVNQSGGVSTASINQEVDAVENQARLIQVGGGNVGRIEQKMTSGGTGVGNVADLYQQGNGNTTTSINQNNDSYSNKAYLNQYGNNNGETRISQTNTSYQNTARIDQGGDGKGKFPARPDGGDVYDTYIPVNGGKAIIEQSNVSHDNKARIGQSGDGHDARIYQNGSVTFSQANIDQYPAASGNNTGLIKQTNSTLSKARITQNAGTYPGAPGTGNNRAEVYQGLASGMPSSGNVTTVVQENGNNISRNEQFGTNNLMEIEQTGNGNLVTGPSGVYASGIAHQEGTMNKSYITQSANGGVSNIASLYQNGSNNLSTINQTGN